MKGVSYHDSLLIFEWQEPIVFGKDIDNTHDELVSLVVPGEVIHVRKISCPYLAYTRTITRRF